MADLILCPSCGANEKGPAHFQTTLTKADVARLEAY